MLKFYVGEGSSNYNEISYNFVKEDFNYGTEILNKRLVHIAAVWSSAEYMKIYVNGILKQQSASNIIKKYDHSLDKRYFIGRNNTTDNNNFIGFKGGVNEVMVYSGPLNDAHIFSHYKYINWPDYQGDHFNVSINPNANTPGVNQRVFYNYAMGPKIVESEIITSTVAFRTGLAWGVNIEIFPDYYYEVDYRMLNGKVVGVPPWSLITLLYIEVNEHNNAEIFYKTIDDWNSQTQYEYRDKVKYTGNNICYFCYSQDGSLGESPPSSPAKWVEIWKEGKVYYNGDIVEFNYRKYTCVAGHTSDFNTNRPPDVRYWN
jgi:hypothetical protein